MKSKRDAGASFAPVTNAGVEIWPCGAAGNSEYGSLSSSTWLRGIQPVDDSGVARFTTIYPGWYTGRTTHIHIEVFVNNRSVKTSRRSRFPKRSTAPFTRRASMHPRDRTHQEHERRHLRRRRDLGAGHASGSASSGDSATFQVGITM